MFSVCELYVKKTFFGRCRGREGGIKTSLRFCLHLVCDISDRLYPLPTFSAGNPPEFLPSSSHPAFFLQEMSDSSRVDSSPPLWEHA